MGAYPPFGILAIVQLAFSLDSLNIDSELTPWRVKLYSFSLWGSIVGLSSDTIVPA